MIKPLKKENLFTFLYILEWLDRLPEEAIDQFGVENYGLKQVIDCKLEE